MLNLALFSSSGSRSLAVGLFKAYKHVAYSTLIDVKKSIDKLVKANKVVVFIKGIPEEPKCGFSNAVVQIMNLHGVKYNSHDVLADESLRQGIKEYTSWPTIPQVFIDGKFIGGCDILLQMHQAGELIEELEKAGIRSALLDRSYDNKLNGEKKDT